MQVAPFCVHGCKHLPPRILFFIYHCQFWKERLKYLIKDASATCSIEKQTEALPKNNKDNKIEDSLSFSLSLSFFFSVSLFFLFHLFADNIYRMRKCH